MHTSQLRAEVVLQLLWIGLENGFVSVNLQRLPKCQTTFFLLYMKNECYLWELGGSFCILCIVADYRNCFMKFFPMVKSLSCSSLLRARQRGVCLDSGCESKFPNISGASCSWCPSAERKET